MKFAAALSALVLISGFSAGAFADHCGGDHAKAETIYGTAKAGGFKTLVAAVDAAGLAETLEGEGPFTVFAPTDEAFAKLPEGTLEKLLADKKALKNVLLYHVVSGKVMAADVVKLDEAKTVGGAKVKIKAKDGVMLNNANVVKTDITASNGVIHVIDTVLLPPKDQKKYSHN